MIQWSVEACRSAGFEHVVVALPPEWEPSSDAETAALSNCTLCQGGAERSHSVRNALQAAGELGEDEAVLVHDAARPLVTSQLIEDLVDSISPESGVEAAIAATRVADTIKVADGAGNVVSTPDRSALRAVQTPQAFRARVLKAALAQHDETLAKATDDAALVEAMGTQVRLIDAPAENFKVTEPKDMQLAELLLAARGGS
jgi:2-C-methyl-D-erythritol 4-phosphate cytidylyltransferase